MSEKKHKGKFTIGRTYSNRDDGDYVHIHIEDDVSGCRIIEATMALEDFAEMILGSSYKPIEFECMAENLGKRRELRSIIVPRPDFRKKESPDLARKWIQKHAPQELVDGWEIHNSSDLFNHHRWAGEGVSVSLIRFVDPQEPTP